MSSIGNVTASNGAFIITDKSGNTQSVDLGTLMMMLKIDQTKNLDEQLAVQLEEIKERNNTINQLTQFLSACRKMKAEGIGQGAGHVVNGQMVHKHLIEVNGQKLPGFKWANDLGIEWSDKNTGPRPDKDPEAWDACWDSNINNIKSKIDTLNNDSQMANIKLQNLLEKRNNAFEMATKVMDTNNQSIASTIRNL